jgi:hypothetical protein
VFEVLALYAACGLIIAVAFAIGGVSQVMPHALVTLGARLVLLPGAVALWPLVLHRWLSARRQQ